VGGSVTQANQFPWMAYLQIKFWSGDTATCGGTLINQDWILTAAHCLYGGVEVRVTLGAHDTTSNSLSSVSFTLLPQSFKSHPNFIYGKVEDDIALIQLPYTISLSLVAPLKIIGYKTGLINKNY
jgi:elastase-2